MSFKLGHIESTGNALKTFYSIKEDVVDNFDVQVDRGGDQTLMACEKSAKADVHLELDFVTQSEYGDLHEVLNNRLYPHKLYLREPAASSQRITITGEGNNIAKQWQTDTPVPTLANFTSDATAFTAGDYTNIQNFTTPVQYQSNSVDYIHYFFRFDLSTWIAAYGLDYLTRLTLLLQDPLVYRQGGADYDEFGYTFHAYNYTTGAWTEIKRQSITIDETNQQFAALRPMAGFTRWADYLSSNLTLFRMTNKQPRVARTVYMSLNYIELFINGYGVVKVNPYDLNWREAYTGAGYVGTVKLQEI